MRRNSSFNVVKSSDEQDLLEKIEENELRAKERAGNFSDTPSSKSSLETVERITSGILVDKRLLRVQKAELRLGAEVVGNHALNVENRRVDARNKTIDDKGRI